VRFNAERADGAARADRCGWKNTPPPRRDRTPLD